MSAKGATMLTKPHPEDALKNHETSKKKLLSPEAKHILKLFENCISQIEIVAALPAVLQLNSESSIVEKELSKALQEHQTLERKLEKLECLVSGEEQEGVAGKARAQLENSIKNSVRDLLRIARVNPDAMSGLRAELVMEVGDSEQILIRGLKKFHSDVERKLMTCLDEELQQLLQEQESSSTVNDLEQKISQEEDKKTSLKEIDQNVRHKIAEKETLTYKSLTCHSITCNMQLIAVLDEMINTLQNNLLGRSRQNADLSVLIDSQRQSLLKTSETEQTRLQKEIAQLNSQLRSLAFENRQEENVIREKCDSLETEIENLLQIFDAEITECQANLDWNLMEYNKEEEEQKELEKPFSALEAECNQILEKRRLAEEKRKEELRELELKTKAAIFAQAWWRGYSTRKALKNKSKSKKAKKGKGKKTK